MGAGSGHPKRSRNRNPFPQMAYLALGVGSHRRAGSIFYSPHNGMTGGFSAMVAYTSPVFWTFFLLAGLTIFRFRIDAVPGEFRTPLYPVVPVAFCAACAYMLYSSINYVRNPEYGPKFGVATYRHQAGAADDDAHPDVAGAVTECLDCAPLGARPGSDVKAVDPLRFVLEPDTYLPRLRLHGPHGQVQQLGDAGHRTALHQD